MLREFRVLLPYLGRYRWAYLLGGLALVGSVALKLWIPGLVGDSIDALERLVDSGTDADRGRVAALVARTALLIAGTAAAVAVVRTASRLWILGTSRRVVHDMRNVVFDHLLRLAPSFYVRNPTGQILSRCINDMQNVQGLMGPVILYLAETAVLFGIGVALMVRTDGRLTLLALAPFPLFLVWARRLARRIQDGSREAQNSLGRVGAKVDESLSGQLVIKTLVLEEPDRRRFREHCEEYRRLNLEVTKSRAALIPMMMALTSLSTVAVLALGGPMVARGALSLGELVQLLLYLQLLAAPTRTLGFVISSLRRGASALERIREIQDARPELFDPERPRRLPSGSSRGLALRVRGLTVRYPPLSEQPHLSGSLPELHAEAGTAGGSPELLERERRVLEDVTFELEPGHTLGVVGHTGSGKTTLVRVLARLHEIERGRVFLDEVDVVDLPLEEVRAAIGLVPQDAFLFSSTLAENIAFGRPDAPRQAIEAAADAARLSADLGQLPLGLDTVVGERGVNLSGGQRQRAALARVLLLEPRLLILDDTLSAVDAETAEAILAELAPFAAQRTTVIVAHRLTTVQHADRILVLEEGRVVEEGAHEELLARGGRYARLWAEQARDTERPGGNGHAGNGGAGGRA